jgi:Spy/CpxP family protein refolding chaperone
MSLFCKRPTQRVLSMAMRALVCAMTTAAIATQAVSAAPKRWWRDPAYQQDLQLTSEQVRQLDSIFERDLPARIALQQQIAKLDRELLRVIGLEVDVAVVMRLSNEVELLRAQRNVRRALMLVAMRKALTSDQRAKLFALPRSSSAAVAH